MIYLHRSSKSNFKAEIKLTKKVAIFLLMIRESKLMTKLINQSFVLVEINHI